MRCISASDLLSAWEKALDCAPLDRGLALLSLCSDESPASLAQLGIGRRDARLLDLYAQLFGDTLEAFAECPVCAERLEYSLSAQDFAAQPGPCDALTLIADGFHLQLRVPTTEDLSAAARCADLEAARRCLIRSSILHAEYMEESVSSSAVPETLTEQIEAALSIADPQSEIAINLSCIACAHTWQVLLDPERFLWAKISWLAKRLLQEVHALARAYGWPEAQILAMTARRREAYLELLEA